MAFAAVFVSQRALMPADENPDAWLHGIRALRVALTQSADASHIREYSLLDLPQREPCANIECRGGGLDLRGMVSWLPPGEHYLYCHGYERATIRPCVNFFKVALSIERGPVPLD